MTSTGTFSIYQSEDRIVRGIFKVLYLPQYLRFCMKFCMDNPHDLINEIYKETKIFIYLDYFFKKEHFLLRSALLYDVSLGFMYFRGSLESRFPPKETHHQRGHRQRGSGVATPAPFKTLQTVHYLPSYRFDLGIK